MKAMTVVNSKEFVANQKKYFDLAVNEEVFIKRGRNRFRLICTTAPNTNEYEEILEPDDDFHRAISADEFRKRLIITLDRIDKKYANKCT